MKNSIKTAFCVLLLVSTVGISQKKKCNDIYFKIDISNFTPDAISYFAYFNMKSSDKSYNHDTYLFTLLNPNFDYKPSLAYSKKIKLIASDVVDPSVYFKDKKPHEVHDFLSLSKKGDSCKRFFLVSPTQNEKNTKTQTKKEYYVWTVSYFGTVRDLVFTNFGKI